MKTEHIIQSVVCILASDGRIAEPEGRFLQQLRQRLGVSPNVVARALHQAKQGKGRVQLPTEPAEQQRVFEVLAHAALADGTVTPQERRILNAVGAKIGLPADRIEHALQAQADSAAEAPPSAPPPIPPPVPGAAPPPVPRKAATKICPKCGAEQDGDRADCLRCGIIFSRFTGAADSPPSAARNAGPLLDVPGPAGAPSFAAPPPSTPSSRRSSAADADDEGGSAAEQLEHLQSISVLLSQAGGIIAVVVVLALIGFGVVNMPDLAPGYRFLIVLALVLAVAAILGHFAALNVAGVVTRGEVVNKWMRRDYRRGRSSYRGSTQAYHYMIEYTFQPGNQASDEIRRGKASVNKSQYSRYRIGAPVKVRYLPGFPWIQRLEVW